MDERVKWIFDEFRVKEFDAGYESGLGVRFISGDGVKRFSADGRKGENPKDISKKLRLLADKIDEWIEKLN